MQISGIKANRQGFASNRDGSPLVANTINSIDFTIGRILVKTKNGDGVKSVKRWSVRPQETVYLVSDEDINVKAKHVAYVFLKNSLSQKGILAFNTGIIDEGYHGPISTLVTNLSMDNIILGKGTEFFRIVIHQVDCDNHQSCNNIKQDYCEYIEKRKLDLLKLPNSFLNKDEIKTEVNRELENKLAPLGIRRLTVYIAIVGIIFAALATFVPLMQSFFVIPSAEKINNTLASVATLEASQEAFANQWRLEGEKQALSFDKTLSENTNELLLSLDEANDRIEQLEKRIMMLGSQKE